jgi:hypothetical protein
MMFANCAHLLTGNFHQLRLVYQNKVLSLKCTVAEFLSLVIAKLENTLSLKLCTIVVWKLTAAQMKGLMCVDLFQQKSSNP